MHRTLESQSQAATELAAQLATLCSKAELLASHTTNRLDLGNLTPSCSRSVAAPTREETVQAVQTRVIFDADDLSNTADEAGLFSDGDALKEQIRNNLHDEPYLVTNLYKKTGIFQSIARSKRFEAASLFLVIASSFWMSVDLDMNQSLLLHEAGIGFQIIAHVIAFFFTLELAIRLLAFQRIRDVVKDFWCVFDFLLVAFIILETWVLWVMIKAFDMQLSDNNIRMLAVLRMLRLVRVLRLIKLFRYMPELLVIVRGIGVAIRAISMVFALLFLVIYVGAIIFRVLLEGSPLGTEHFETVMHAMGTLLLDCALSGTRGGPLMREAYSQHPIHSILIFAFVLLTNVTMMGLLVGLLVQTIKKVAEVEEDEKKEIRNKKTMHDFWRLINDVDENSDGYITIDEFHKLLSQRESVRLLKKMDVDPEGLVLLSDFVFAEGDGRLSQVDFNQWVLDMRGTQRGTIKDHIVTRKFVATKLMHSFQNTSRRSFHKSRPWAKSSQTCVLSNA